MTLMRWDPFSEFSSLRRAMDRVFDDFVPPRLWRPEQMEMAFPCDLYETDDKVVVKAVLPGIDPNDVDISVTNEGLTIKGQSKHEQQQEGENWYRREIRWGAFSRTLPLPTRVEYDRAEADYENGILIISLPKAEEVRPKSIKVTAKKPELSGADPS